MNTIPRRRVGCCITAHGFGHAARACGVMEALAARCPVCFDLVTTVPDWFFAESLSVPYRHHGMSCDVGLVQRDSLQEDCAESLERLDAFYPPARGLVDRVAALLDGCSLVICDIAPLGVSVAKEIGAVSVLVENFTWDWIYQKYLDRWPAFSRHISCLQELYSMVDYRIQAEPVCERQQCDLVTPPIARQRRQPRSVVRQRLQVAEEKCMVLVTMGGVGGTVLPLEEMAGLEQVFVLPGRGDEQSVRGNLILLPSNSGIYHPDLIGASDVVIGKVGYSTLAEVYQADIPFGYIRRPEFRESARLAEFINREMTGAEISGKLFQGTDWLHRIPEMCAMTSGGRTRENGAHAAADFLADLLTTQSGH